MHSNPGTELRGNQELSKNVYFIDENGNKVQPIFQRDTDTNVRSYRVYISGGNTKAIDKDVFCYKELAILLTEGHSVRCRLPNGDSSNRKLNSKDIVKLFTEIERT